MDIFVSAVIDTYPKVEISTELKSEFGLSDDLLIEFQEKVDTWKIKRKNKKL